MKMEFRLREKLGIGYLEKLKYSKELHGGSNHGKNIIGLLDIYTRKNGIK